MATVSYPGVYVEEVSSGIRPIEAAGTSTAAFVGFAEMGSDAEAQRVTSWTQFQRLFGGYIDDAFLPHAVFHFFNNGGSLAYILRVTRSDAATATVTVANRATPSAAGISFSAKSKGAWGNRLFLEIQDGTGDPQNEFSLILRRQDDPNVVPANFQDLPALEVLDDLSMNPDAPNFVETVLAQSSSFLTADVLAGNTALQRGSHRSGPFAPAATITLGANRQFQINIDNDGFHVVTLDAAVAGATGLADMAAEIQTRVRALAPNKKKVSTPTEAFSEFVCERQEVAGVARLVLLSGTNQTAPATPANPGASVLIQNAAATNAAVLLKLGPANGGLSQNALAIRRPAAAIVQLGDSAIDGPVTAVTLGTDGVALTSEINMADAFARLDSKTDVSLLAVPEFPTAVMMDLGVAYCENRPLRDIFYIGAMPEVDDEVAEAESFRASLTKPNSYGAVYFPWVKVLDPTGRSRSPISLPPVGHMAGLYARIDANRGVWKAPAGVEASLNGVVGLAADLSDVDQGILNRVNVNVLRRFNTAGLVSWGARTVASDPEYKYIPVRRTAIMLRVSLYNGLQWAVFEPNDEDLWGQIRLNVNAFMMTLFRRGAFQGTSAKDAFFVKCDGETTTQADIDLGIVNVLVGFAPLKPAEFIVVKISQVAGQSA